MKRVFLIFGGLMLAGCGAFEGGLFAPKDRAPETAEAQATTTAAATDAFVRKMAATSSGFALAETSAS